MHAYLCFIFSEDTFDLISYLVLLLTNYMEQSPSWEANSHSSSQEIPYLL
jgi:hypothetical protein